MSESLHFWIINWKTKDSAQNDRKHSLTGITSTSTYNPTLTCRQSAPWKPARSLRKTSSSVTSHTNWYLIHTAAKTPKASKFYKIPLYFPPKNTKHIREKTTWIKRAVLKLNEANKLCKHTGHGYDMYSAISVHGASPNDGSSSPISPVPANQTDWNPRPDLFLRYEIAFPIPINYAHLHRSYVPVFIFNIRPEGRSGTTKVFWRPRWFITTTARDKHYKLQKTSKRLLKFLSFGSIT
jgi:hypothetical protein